MSRPILLVFLLIILIITSQFEWKQQLVMDLEAAPSISEKQLRISEREEAVKERVIDQLRQVQQLKKKNKTFTVIILSQEKNIQRLNEVVRSLREQLQLCRTSKEATNGTASQMTENVIELEGMETLED